MYDSFAEGGMRTAYMAQVYSGPLAPGNYVIKEHHSHIIKTWAQEYGSEAKASEKLLEKVGYSEKFATLKYVTLKLISMYFSHRRKFE